MQSRSDYTFTI